jgi:hypothetical protein
LREREEETSDTISLSLFPSFSLSLCVSGGEKCCKKLELFDELVNSSSADLAGM